MTPHFILRSFGTALALALALSTAAVAPAQAGGPAAGTIVITERMLNPALSTFQADLKSEARATLTKDPDSETWKVHFVAHLKKSPGSPDVNIVFYELGQAAKAATKAADSREPVQAYPIKTRQTATMLISEVNLKTEEGFKPGGKYQVLITRLINGKEEVYARTQVELK